MRTNIFTGLRYRYSNAPLLGAVVALLAGIASTAHAATITQTLDFRLNSGLSSSVLNFNPFDSSLGALQNVEISFTATRRHAWALWNLSGQSRAVPYNVSLTDTTLTFDGNAFDFVDLTYGPSSSPVLTPTDIATYGSELSAGAAQFLLGLDPTFASAFKPATTLSTINGNFTPSSFGGVLDIAYAFDPGIFTIDSSSFLSASLVDVFGEVTVTYDYETVPSVPDTTVGLSLISLLAGMLTVARFTRARGMAVE